jgi:predicted DNA-binding transcriptional regulator AlpA
MHDQQTFIPAGQLRARYGISAMTVWRWLQDKPLGFPRPIRINRRRFWKLAELEQWEASRAAA